jgi:translation initiation factor 2B subunit (eIF-2B alpha/beta/delta family)
MTSTGERVPVVTVFLYRGNKIALIKRSPDVGTYQGKWAAFSGYVERLPINQAWQELSEEAGVNEMQVELKGIGTPLPVDDAKAGHKWLVLPFLFELAKDVEIKTDWEASEWGWFHPDEIQGMDTVPGLNAALDRVWPAFGDHEFWEGLAHVATNTDDGATELARRGLEVLGGYVQAHYPDIDRVELLRSIRAFSASRLGMGVFPDLGARLMLAIDQESGLGSFDALVTELLGMVEDATDLCVNEAAKGLTGIKRLFTLSYSEAVADSILTWHTDDSEVVIAESGPRNEGLKLAEYLIGQGVNVRTVPDADIACGVRSCEAVLFGCDGITAENGLLNKACTREAVETADAGGIPAYVVAQTFKIMPPGWPAFLERQAPADYDETSTVFIGPSIFDLTPLSRFKTIFTEEGILDIDRLAELRDELSSVDLIPAV